MSDAPLPLGNTDREGKRAEPAGSAAGHAEFVNGAETEIPPGNGHLREGSVDTPAMHREDGAATDEVQGVASEPSVTPSEPAPLQENAEHASRPDGQANGAAAPHMLPLPVVRFPDTWSSESRNPLPEFAERPPTETAADPAPEAFAARPVEPADPSASHVEPPAEIVMEVSPIFSALDAADQAVFEAPQEPPPAPEPPDHSILLPFAPGLDQGAPDAPSPVAAAPSGEVMPAFEEPAAETPAAPSDEHSDAPELAQDAAARIAVEANATAEALESLKRLLDQKLPMLDPAPAPATAPFAPPRAAAPQPPPVYRAPPQPVKPPPMVPLVATARLAPMRVEQPVRQRWSFSGFLAGFALSWVFGAMLYVVLSLV
jgi:hypothetical protein